MTLLTPRQFAKKKDVHFSTVYRWIEQGKLPAIWKTKRVPMIPDDATLLSDTQEERVATLSHQE